jgi:hypothetical protein
MVTKEQIQESFRPYMKLVLLVAESSLPSDQFKAFRTILLDQFGESGWGKELDRLLQGNGMRGRARHGQE